MGENTLASIVIALLVGLGMLGGGGYMRAEESEAANTWQKTGGTVFVGSNDGTVYAITER